jgi:NADPH-dependent F420 reductase
MMQEKLPVIGIIGGTGKEGTGLALRWAAAGYQVIIGSRQAERAVEAAKAINQRIGSDRVAGKINADAALQADMCVMTVIQAAHQQAIEGLKNELQGKILVDATSRVDYRDPHVPEPPSAAQVAQQILGPKVRIVAAFQNIPAHSLRNSPGEPLDADALVCSDDLQAAEAVIKLAKAAGMRAYYAGELANAMVVEGLTAILISLNKYYKIKNASVRVTGIPAE